VVVNALLSDSIEVCVACPCTRGDPLPHISNCTRLWTNPDLRIGITAVSLTFNTPPQLLLHLTMAEAGDLEGG